MAVKILVTEDDVFLRDGLCEMLKKEGYDVVTAGTIEDAKASFLKESFNLIILDVMLPDGNGFDMCGFIRSKNEDVPILFLTACDDEVQARGAKVVLITDESEKDCKITAEITVTVPETHKAFQSLLLVLPLQLLSYYIAKRLGCDIDRPKNLAKSVTVE